MPLALPAARFRGALVALAVTLAAGLPALAQDLHADDSRFNLFNDTARAVDSFAVMMPSGLYSDNWLGARLEPGTGLTLQFPFSKPGTCDMMTRITYEDGSVQEVYVTYCGTAAIFLENTGIRFD